MTFWSGLLIWLSLTLIFAGIGIAVDMALDGPEALPPGWWVPVTVLVAMMVVAAVMLA